MATSTQHSASAPPGIPLIWRTLGSDCRLPPVDGQN